MSSGSSEGELVFVYGTLRRAASEAARMEDAKWIGRRLATGRLLRIGSQPALVGCPDPLSMVDGDLFQVSVRLLEELDRFHGLEGGLLVGDCYERVRRTVSEHGYHVKSSSAWMWVWTGPTAGSTLVRSGDWLDVEQPRARPFFTAVALACALGLPGFGLVAWWLDYQLGGATHEGVLGALSVLALASPIAGCFAYYFAESRREEWVRFRMALLAILAMECVPVLIMAVALLPEVVSWFL